MIQTELLVCMIENYARTDSETCISIDKSTEKAAQFETFSTDTAFRLRLSFENENEFVLQQRLLNSDGFQEIGRYNLSAQNYIDM